MVKSYCKESNISDTNWLRYVDQNFTECIDPMQKCLPIKNYFVSIKISPTNLVFELIIEKNFYSQMKLVGPI